MSSNMQVSGDQVRLARLAFGFSLEELGEMIGTSRQFVHLIETDAKLPSVQSYEALKDVLGVNDRFLAKAFTSNVRPEQCHFRSLRSRPAYVTSQVLARGTLIDRLLVALENYVGLPQVNFPDVPLDEGVNPEAAAEAARQHWGLGETAPIDSVIRVAENAGAIVTCFGDLSEKVDAFSMDRRRPIIVRSEAKESVFRQRFDIAHEIGHLVMHKGLQTGDQITEAQAHRFAGAFLFPRKAVLNEFPRGARLDWQALERLKIRRKMSLAALVRRGYDLKLLTPAQYKRANVHLAKTGQKKVEKFDDHPDFPLEQPELLHKAFDFINSKGGNGAIEVATLVGMEAKLLEVITGLRVPKAFSFENDNVLGIFSRT